MKVIPTFRRIARLTRVNFSTDHQVKNCILELFTSPDCSLCFHFKQQLSPYLEKYKISLREVDITQPKNTRYFKLYKYDIPVLHVNGVFNQKHRFNADLLEKTMKTGSGGGEC